MLGFLNISSKCKCCETEFIFFRLFDGVCSQCIKDNKTSLLKHTFNKIPSVGVLLLISWGFRLIPFFMLAFNDITVPRRMMMWVGASIIMDVFYFISAFLLRFFIFRRKIHGVIAFVIAFFHFIFSFVLFSSVGYQLGLLDPWLLLISPVVVYKVLHLESLSKTLSSDEKCESHT